MFVTCPAGNYGPGDFTITNITYGVSTIDRDFLAIVILDDDKIYNGISLDPSSYPILGQHLV